MTMSPLDDRSSSDSSVPLQTAPVNALPEELRIGFEEHGPASSQPTPAPLRGSVGRQERDELEAGASCTMAAILMIDDEVPIRAFLRTALEATGYEVTEAVNGREGLELYRHRPTNLVITDILMPELNGLDMLLALMREFIDAKVIAISGLGEEENVLGIAKLLGARWTFEKPFGLPQLLDAVRYELAH